MYGTYATHLFEMGYQPIPIKPGTKAPAHNGWQTETGLDPVQQHITQRPDHGVGITNVNAADIDILDEEMAAQIEAWIDSRHPGYLKRVGKAPKFLVPLHPDSELSAKIKSLWVSDDGQDYAIEMLHKGQQQFVAYGIHPDTEQPYTWFGSDPYLTRAADLDLWSSQDIADLIQYFDSLCEQKGLKRKISATQHTNMSGWSPAELEILKDIPSWVVIGPVENQMAVPEPETSTELLQKYLDALPLSYCDERETWFRVGGIIHDVTHGSPEGFEMFDAWSRKSTKYNGNPRDTTTMKWADYTTKPGNAGVGTLVHWLMEEGIEVPSTDAPPETVVVPLNGTCVSEQIIKTTPLITNIQGMINQFVYVERDSMVGDITDSTTRSLKHFKEALLPNQERIVGPRGGATVVKLVDTWMASKYRQSAHDLTYYPKPNAPLVVNMRGDVCFNTYRAPVLPYVDVPNMSILQPFLDHLGFLIPSKEAYKVLLDWIAFCIQYPWIKPFAFLIITPQLGVGKGVLFQMLRKILGGANVNKVTEEMLKDSNQFNDFLVGSTLVLWDEVKVKSLGYDKLKTYISDDLQQINAKYGRLRQEMTYNSNIMYSNHLDAICISDPSDRRIYATECRAVRREPSYYTKLFNLIAKDDELASNFLALMRQRDISKFDPHNPPMTETKMNMMMASKSDGQNMIDDMIEAETGPCMFDIVTPNLVHYACQDEDGAFTSKRALGAYLQRITADNKLQYDFRVPTGGYAPLLNVVRPRNLVCVRNYKKWAHASSAALRLEYMRAREAVMSGKTKDIIIRDVQDTSLEMM